MLPKGPSASRAPLPIICYQPSWECDAELLMGPESPSCVTPYSAMGFINTTLVRWRRDSACAWRSRGRGRAPHNGDLLPSCPVETYQGIGQISAMPQNSGTKQSSSHAAEHCVPVWARASADTSEKGSALERLWSASKKPQKQIQIHENTYFLEFVTEWKEAYLFKKKKKKKDGPTVLKIQPMSSQTYTCSDTLAPKYILLHVHIDTDTDTCTHLLHSPSDANTARISQPTSPASPKLGLLFTRGTEVSTTFI